MPIPLYELVEGKHRGKILLHAIRDASTNGSLDIAHTLGNGFYHVTQYNQDYTPYDATVHPTSVGQTSIPVQMYNGTDLLPRVWKLTRQYGVKDGFTIVPVSDPIGNSSGLGVTALDKNKAVVVEKASSYPIWTIRCDERIDYHNDDDTTTTNTIYLFRILEVNSNLCWTTDNSDQVVIDTVPTGRPPANQLYRLVLTHPVTIQSVNSVDLVATTATDANIVRNYYFGYTASKSNYLALQLKTDARDQGWADEPQQGLWSWFEIAILHSAPQTGARVTEDQIKKDNTGNLCTWLSHTIPLTGVPPTYTEQTGPVFDANHPLWNNLAKGNVISVLVVAQYLKWTGDVRRGNLAIEELVEEPIPV